jgi:predicted small lipoprotein YifL
MKKVLALVLALVLVLSLVACGGNGEAEKKDETIAKTETEASKGQTVQLKSLGETVSTDIMDFTLKEAALSYYASALHDDTYAKPIDHSDGGIFTAAKGRVLVCMTFTIKNNDRDSLDGGGSFAKWPMLTISNENESSAVNGFDLNNKDGRVGALEFGESEVSYNGGSTFTQNTSSNIIVEAGRNITVKVVGIAKIDPANLNDTFYLTVMIPNSNNNNEPFTYKVN